MSENTQRIRRILVSTLVVLGLGVAGAAPAAATNESGQFDNTPAGGLDGVEGGLTVPLKRNDVGSTLAINESGEFQLNSPVDQ